MIKYIALSIISVSMLTACGGKEGKQASAREILGMQRNAPDEFRVVARPPLSVPSEFFLNPPSYGDAAPIDSAVKPIEKQAQEIIQEENSHTSTETAILNSDILELQNDSSLLSHIGAETANPDIRKLLHVDGVDAIKAEENKSLLEKLNINSGEQKSIVNAPKEAERILKNKRENKPVTEGEVPTYNPDGDTPLEKLINKL